ncbi:Sigma-54-dependent Fis family transcriptional regulator [Candidatus Magnetomoraceae bacterium gMMP-15]
MLGVHFNMSKILIINDNQQKHACLKKALIPSYNIKFWSGNKDIAAFLKQKEYEIILLSLQLKNNNSFNILKNIKDIIPDTYVIITSEIEKADLIVKSVKEGAFDFLAEPFSNEKLLLSIQRALEHRSFRYEIDYLRREQDIIYNFNNIIAKSPSMKNLISTLKKFAMTDSTILITGETGVGKSFLSGGVHFNSGRRKKPFIKINCANIQETLLESSLFGHEKGSFTGADKLRIGRIEQANGGTIFLDEIAEMSPALQAKLLRVLEEKEFERVGGNATIHSDVRIIAATNKNPEDQVAIGKFREDLYYRLNVLRVHLPPLRERKKCIESLAFFMLDRVCHNLKKKIKGFSPEVIEEFKNYSWPGNIRQLANIIERAAILEESDIIELKNIDLPKVIIKTDSSESSPNKQVHSLEDNEKDMILKALENSLWVQKDAAKLLGISSRTLNYKIKKFGITHRRWRKNK